MSLYEFLLEAELQHYYEEIKNGLKIMKATQLKYVTTDDLTQIGMSKPEQRRFKKMYSKYFPNNYLSKIKKLLSSGKKTDSDLPTLTEENLLEAQLYSDHSIKVPCKHIIPVENIAINKELGEGEFGVVQQGIWSNDSQRIQVAIKCLCRERMQTNSMEFLKEAAVMHSIEHPNIVRLYGVVLHPDSLMLVTELAPLRSLLECLKELSLRPNFPVLTLCDFASQICDGMSYLEAKRLIHRDLAARNILVFSKNRVKISDFGLSRALRAGKDYYQTNFNVNLKLPIAWCAPECISYLRFTSASDVWAYAVTLWEMFSYGFQPWAAFSGHQILMAIDEPNFQRLEQPDCCPNTYYELMKKCWQHDPLARPKFHEIALMLPECCPQQVQATVNVSHEGKRNDQLDYRIGDIITILQKGGPSNQANWKGVLKNCKTGYFNPQTTIPYVKTVQQVQATNLHAIPSPETGSNRSTSLLGGTFRNSLLRSDSKRHTFTAKRPLQREMISAPQGEMKHTGHIGLDGAYFGDVSFLDPAVSNYNNPVPRQIVTPYKPSEDLEQMPLINPNSPSHLTGSVSTPPYPLLNQDPSQPRTFDEAVSQMPMPKNGVDEIDSVTCDEFSSKSMRLMKFFGESTLNKTLLSKIKSTTLGKSFRASHVITQKAIPANNDKNKVADGEVPHEYHEISDTEEALPPHKTLPESTRYDKEFSKELMAELDNMLSSINRTDTPELVISKFTTIPEDDTIGRSSHSPKVGKKKLPSVKPISAYDQKTLDTAIALANELTTRSMNDLDNNYQKTPSSPIEKNKFHSKLVATLTHLGHTSQNVCTQKLDSKQERRNFSKEAQSVPDLQSTFTEASKLAYASLIDQPAPSLSLMVDEARHLHQFHYKVHLDDGELPGNEVQSGHMELVEIRRSDITDESNLNRSTFSTGKRPDMLTDTVDNIDGKRNERSSCNNNLPVMNLEANEIPLPPRNRTKSQNVSKQRHTRKHPLMAPVQNLLFNVEKVLYNKGQIDNSLVKTSNIPEQYENYSVDKITENNSKANGAIPKKNVKRKLRSQNNDNIDEPLYMNFEFSSKVSSSSPREFFGPHSLLYETKLDNLKFDKYTDEVDGSLNLNASTNPFSEKEIVNISNPFDLKKFKDLPTEELPFVNQVNIRSDYIDCERESSLICSVVQKVEESSLSKDSPDHVSVEDLLEFAGQKPCGRQRGAESDEVRIMLKVLNREQSHGVITPEDCLQVLEFCEWDVYHTLKLAEVYFAPGIHADIPECARVLFATKGDTKQAITLLTLQ